MYTERLKKGKFVNNIGHYNIIIESLSIACFKNNNENKNKYELIEFT